MLTSFYSGLSGLSAYAAALDVVGNNLANINTPGFKASTLDFHDVVTRTFGGIAANSAGNPMQIGLGVFPSAVNGIFSQGSIQVTNEATNVAIEGNGFFVVGQNEEDYFYTRNGSFYFDDEGYLVNSSGYYVLGYTEKDPTTGHIIASGALHKIYLPGNTVSSPEATTFFQIFMNLDNRADVGDTYSASVVIYDSKGARHTLTITFTHAGGTPDTWNYEITIPGEDVVGGTAGTPYTLATGSVQFDANGALLSPATDVDINIPAFTNGADAMTVTWDLWNDDLTVATLTGYPLESGVYSTNQNGYPPGSLTSIIVSREGVIQGVFSNGQVEELAQLALATFNNPRGLLRMGLNLYAETEASGTPSIGAPQTGGRGAINGGALESSNVDMATEFVKMLVFERGYQANSRTIRTSDEMVQEALAIKR